MENNGYGWKMFAWVVIMLGGTFNVIDGLVGLTNANYLKNLAGGKIELPLTNDIKTWSWVVLIIGTIMIVASFLIIVGNMFGRVVGVIAAGVNAIIQLAYLGHFPLWSFTMILVDMLVIYGLVVHGGPLDEWAARDAT
jgi:hypothetical protein